MIKLTCTSCRKTLEIDDGFAGGVCRCQYCGTIQTVPAHLKGGTRTAVAPALGGQKALVKGSERVSDAAEGSGLDDLAQAVASSGVHSRRLTAPAAAAGSRPQTRLARLMANRTVLIAAGGVAGLVIGIVLVMLLMRGGDPKKNPPGSAPAGDKPGAADPTTPKPAPTPIHPSTTQGAAPKPPSPTPPQPQTGSSFMEIPLKGPTVIFLLDRGVGTRDTFDAIKGGMMRCLRSLQANIRYQIIFWETGGLIVTPESPLNPNPQNIQACQELLKNTICFGQSHIEPALEKALAQNPAEIVIATGKYLEDPFATAVLAAAKGRNVKIHTVCLGGGSRDLLKSIADKTGGTFVEIVGQALSEYADDSP